MKFLIVNRHREDVVGGSELQCDLLARELGARGHAVSYAVMQSRRAQYASPYACMPLDSPLALAFRRVLRATRPDVVYWRFNKHHLLACALQARLAGATLVFASSHDDDTRAWGGPAARGARATGRGIRGLAALRAARDGWRRLGDATNYLGHELVAGHVAQHMGQTGIQPPQRTRVIRSSVFTAAEPFHWERPFVVWVANLKPRKRPEAFVELARELAAEPIDFLAVGALQDERYAFLAEPARVPPNFHYLGARAPAEVNGIIAAAQFLVLTCEPEGFPNVLMQAWNLAKPTLSLGYDPEGMLSANRLGTVAGSAAELAQAARALLHDPAEREAIGVRAARFAAENFTLSANAQQLERFCEELLARRRRA